MSSHHQADPRAEEKQMVIKEMLPYFLYAAVPIIVTIIIAFVFGPSIGG